MNCVEQKLKQEVKEIIEQYTTAKDNLVPILNDVQVKYGYIPQIAQSEISEYLSIPMAEIYGVITFYSRFTLKPKGKYNVAVCLGTACYVKGSQKILDRLKDLQQRHGWSDYKIAKEAGLSPNTVSNIYRRGNTPSMVTLEALCKAFGITMA